MTSKQFFLIALFSFLLFNSCTTEFFENSSQNPETELVEEQQFTDVDERLWTYFEDFENEAALRGIDLDLIDLEITGAIENITEDGVAGTCQYGAHLTHVTVDLPFWNRSSNLIREMVVFHELGHCALGRGHTETENANGVCLSVMNSGTTNCRLLYNQANRTFYLDELFLEL